MLSQRVRNIAPSKTLEIDAKAKQLKKEGKDVVIFGAGEPDFNTPENIKQAAKKAIDDNFTRYTPVGGIPELKKAISEKFRSFNKISYDVSEITVGCGGKHVLFNACMAVLEKGDEAILPVPYWVSFEEMIKLGEAKPVLCETDEKFKLTAENVKDKITKKTKLLILNSPSNPSGAIVEHSEIKKLTITCNSVSKTYAMTGWRIGYCGAPKEVINAMENLQGHSTSNPSNIAQMAALEALTGQQDSVKEMVKAFDERRKLIHRRLNEIDGISCVEPEGAFYAFPDISGTGMDSMDFSSKLLDEALVRVVPGLAFGKEGHVRLSYATSMNDISKGMDRIEKWLKSRK